MITYVTGDATEPQGDDPIKVIAHVCNNVGAWGKGFVLSINKRWPHVEDDYRQWSSGVIKGPPQFALGRVRMIIVRQRKTHTWVANMVAQDGLISKDNPQPIRYDALERCLNTLGKKASSIKEKTGVECSIHMPRIGCGLAGGTWTEVEQIINRALVQKKVKVYVYDLPVKKKRKNS